MSSAKMEEQSAQVQELVVTAAPVNGNIVYETILVESNNNTISNSSNNEVSAVQNGLIKKQCSDEFLISTNNNGGNNLNLNLVGGSCVTSNINNSTNQNCNAATNNPNNAGSIIVLTQASLNELLQTNKILIKNNPNNSTNNCIENNKNLQSILMINNQSQVSANASSVQTSMTAPNSAGGLQQMTNAGGGLNQKSIMLINPSQKVRIILGFF